MNQYTIKFTVIHPGDTPPDHHKIAFKTDLDVLGAADEAMCQIFDKYEKGKEDQILFKSIELTNAQEVYQLIKKQEG